MTLINCYRCFARFSPRKLHFKCLRCGPHHQAGAPLRKSQQRVFAWKPYPWQNQPPPQALCDGCNRYTSIRVCPACSEELPHYVGRIQQQIIAVTGCSASGKTVYHWSILHQLRERLAADPRSYVSSMFEDDVSMQTFQKLDSVIRFRLELPELTQDMEMRRGKFNPIVVRLLRRRRRREPHTNLIFYDHRGELIHSLKDVEYLRYLAHARGLIYLVGTNGDPENAREGLNAVINKVRVELRLPIGRKLDKPLAVVVSKADQQLFPDVFAKHGRRAVLPDEDQGLDFWHSAPGTRRRRIHETSARCREYLQTTLGHHALVSLAENNFTKVRYFAVSALNGALDSQLRLQQVPLPLAVEHPLFWLLGELN